MSKPILVRIPDAVVEKGELGRSQYWLRQESGNYMPLKAQNYRLHSRGRFGRQASEDIRLEAAYNPVSIRSIAGVLPAVYRDGMEEFLVPEFIPMGKLPAAENPPPEFRKLSRALSKLMDGGQGACGEASKARKRMIEIYKEARGVSVFGASRSVPINHPGRLLGMNYRPGGFPCDDHAECFRSSGRRGCEGMIWTSQPYDVDVPAIVGFAHQYGLSVTVSMKWGWHYPGKAPLIEWSKAESKH